MAQKPTTDTAGKPAKPGRDDRLKAALKANMGRRKAQARARAVEKDANAVTDTATGGQEQAGKPADT